MPDQWLDVLRIGLGVLGGAGFFVAIVAMVYFALRDRQ